MKVAGVVRTHFADRWSWLAWPWIILGISFVCNLVIASTVSEEIKTGGLVSIFIYMLVLGIISVGQMFPFLIAFGVRRKDFFLGTAVTVVLTCGATTVILLAMGWLEKLTNYWGGKLHFFRVAYILEGPLLQDFWISFALLLNLFFCGFAISALYRKFGRNGTFAFFILLGLTLTCMFYVVSFYDKWQAIADWVSGLTVISLANGAFLLTLLYAGAAYLMLRKATN
jgi:hypothetical protein